MTDYLHRHREFGELLRIVGDKLGIIPALVEKDYWIMHCLFGLKQAGYHFELKGGTSLSKGFGIIDRFSEDIDLRINPPDGMTVATGRNQDKPRQIESRRNFYDRLAADISIDGITAVERDHVFDDEKFRSGGIRLHYPAATSDETDLKEGVLLELGFDDVTPNRPVDISSWAYDYAADKVDIADNRALATACYHPGYTLVEKLQTISTKFRKQRENNEFPANFLRHYYDVYALLQNSSRFSAPTATLLTRKSASAPKSAILPSIRHSSCPTMSFSTNMRPPITAQGHSIIASARHSDKSLGAYGNSHRGFNGTIVTRR